MADMTQASGMQSVEDGDAELGETGRRASKYPSPRRAWERGNEEKQNKGYHFKASGSGGSDAPGNYSDASGNYIEKYES